jgi:hypothetical protein
MVTKVPNGPEFMFSAVIASFGLALDPPFFEQELKIAVISITKMAVDNSGNLFIVMIRFTQV